MLCLNILLLLSAQTTSTPRESSDISNSKSQSYLRNESGDIDPLSNYARKSMDVNGNTVDKPQTQLRPRKLTPLTNSPKEKQCKFIKHN